MRIPAPHAASVELRCADLLDRPNFGERWRYASLSSEGEGFWSIDVDAMGLGDGTYEYEFVLDGDRANPVPDPYAKELTRFGGYRGLFRIRGGRRWASPFDWGGELPPGTTLPENNRIVIYEMPLRWMVGEHGRQVGLGTFDQVIFAHLDRLAALGVNCIELLPVQDSPDTLNWGYGTRFFFAPDLDMGGPVDLKLFVKRCHRRGIRVVLDVVMNHAKECPLARLARERYFLADPGEEPGRGESYGGDMFRYRRPVDGRRWARLLHLDMARFWIEEYRVDGFRIDEFKGIDNWEFIQEFRDHAWAVHQARFPGRPFIVIAEDSWSRTDIVANHPDNPDGRKIVDAMWNFSYRDEIRRLMLNQIDNARASRRERIVGMVSGRRRWDELQGGFRGGFGDLSETVAYVTSHDVEKDGERRFVNHVLSSLLRYFGHGDGSFHQVRAVADDRARETPSQPRAVLDLYDQALDRVRSAYAVLMTSVGIPMLLAGEEFGDVHDTNHHDWQLKMSDPVDWHRREAPGHAALEASVGDLIWLRHGHPALHRNEVEFFHFHPAIEEEGGSRVFAYARTAGRPLGSGGQVVTVVNAGGQGYPAYDLPWPWAGGWAERGMRPGGGSPRPTGTGWARLELRPFEARVFETY